MHTNPFATEAAQYAHLRPTYPDATEGTVSLEALELAGEDGQNGKVLIDIANPLAFSQGMPPTLSGMRFVQDIPLCCRNRPDISRSLVGATVQRDHGGDLKGSTPPALVAQAPAKFVLDLLVGGAPEPEHPRDEMSMRIL